VTQPDVGLSFNVTRFFFDRPWIEQLIGAKSRRALGHAGGLVRRIAQRSMRRTRKKVSAPGEPPRAHEGSLRNRIWYAYSPPRSGGHGGSVVAGPTRFNAVYFSRHRQPVRGTVPSVLEHGGDITVLEVWVERHWGRRTRRGRSRLKAEGRWVRADLRSKRRLAGRKLRHRTAHVRARPYMGPALAKALPRVRQFWSGGLRAA